MDAVNYRKMVPRDVTGRVRYPHEVSRRERWLVGTVTTGFEVVFTGVHYKGHPTNPGDDQMYTPIAHLRMDEGEHVAALGWQAVLATDMVNGDTASETAWQATGTAVNLANAFTDGKDVWTLTGTMGNNGTRDTITLAMVSSAWPGASWGITDWDGGGQVAKFDGVKKLWLGMAEPLFMSLMWAYGYGPPIYPRYEQQWGCPGAKILSVSVS